MRGLFWELFWAELDGRGKCNTQGLLGLCRLFALLLGVLRVLSGQIPIEPPRHRDHREERLSRKAGCRHRRGELHDAGSHTVNYSASVPAFTASALFFVPGGEALCAASSSASVSGRGMQKPLTPQGCHGELLEVNVTGAQLVAVADVELLLICCSKSSTTITGQGAIVGSGAGSITVASPITPKSDSAVRPGPFGSPVSSTSVAPSGTRTNVNLGQTFSDESNVVVPMFIVPVEALKVDRFTKTAQDSVPPPV